MTTTPLSGTQTTIAHAAYSATIAAVGASLRELRHDGRHLVVPFDADAVRPVYRGAILAPWPNRVVDGLYWFDGVSRQLPLTEPERGHALHGLLAWARFEVTERREASVRLEAEIVPTDGYPWPVRVAVTYELSSIGLTTTVVATNDGVTAAPYGVAPHPYLVAGDGAVDDWTLQVPAAEVLEVTPDRLIPVGVVSAAADPGLDFRAARRIRDTFVDHAFTALLRDDHGTARVTLTADSGAGVAMSWGPELPWVQVHTADRPAPEPSRRGLAVEPMTCPPGAFSSGVDLIRLEPGATHSASWLIAAI